MAGVAHDWEHLRIPMKDFGCLGRRRCRRCFRVQEKVDEQIWGRVVGYSWSPLAGRCPGKPDKEKREPVYPKRRLRLR